MMKQILLLEDDTALGRGIQLALQGPEAQMTIVNTLAQAREALGKGRFDLLLLDVNLPDGSGLELLRQVRGQVPVILLTANDLETDIVTGLESGAEDYITKPFSLAVLRARVNAQLRRAQARLDAQPGVRLTVYYEDENKAGGRFETVAGNLKKIDCYLGGLVLTDGREIPFFRICDLELDD